MKQRKWWLVALAVAAAGIAVAVQEHRSASPEVTVAEAVTDDLRLRIAASGLVEADSDDLSFKGQGKLVNLYVREGDRVSQGDVLARIDTTVDPSVMRSVGSHDVIQAPYEGTVVTIYHREGAVVAPGLPVLRFVQDGQRWVTAFIDSDDAAYLRPGQRLQCRAGGYLSEAWDLDIVSVGKEAVQRQDMPGSARQVRVRCEPVSDRFPLVAGAEVDVDADVPIARNVVLVPTAAVVHEGPDDWVWIVEGDTVKRRDVKLGPNNFDLIEIRAGLAEGESVVVHGKDGLEEGLQVAVVRDEDDKAQGGK